MIIVVNKVKEKSCVHRKVKGGGDLWPMSGGGVGYEGPVANATADGGSDRSSDLHGLLPELNGVELAMSLSPKHSHSIAHHQHQSNQHHQVLSHLQQLHHSTPFSVTDILSPIEESYRKLELVNPPSPYRYYTYVIAIFYSCSFLK